MRRHITISPALVTKILGTLFVAIVALLCLGIDSCDMREPNRCEQMGGYCMRMDEMCDLGFNQMEGMGCSVQNMATCCIPDEPPSQDLDCAELSRPE